MATERYVIKFLSPFDHYYGDHILFSIEDRAVLKKGEEPTQDEWDKAAENEAKRLFKRLNRGKSSDSPGSRKLISLAHIIRERHSRDERHKKGNVMNLSFRVRVIRQFSPDTRSVF